MSAFRGGGTRRTSAQTEFFAINFCLRVWPIGRLAKSGTLPNIRRSARSQATADLSIGARGEAAS
jgi:hypothetical protein